MWPLKYAPLATATTMLAAFAVSAAADLRYRVRPVTAGCPEGPTTMLTSINNNGQVCGLYSGFPIFFGFLWHPETGALEDIGSLPSCNSPGSGPMDVNDLGHVAGADNGFQCSSEAFFWTPEMGIVGLGDLPGGSFHSEARAVNNLDQVVGIATGPTNIHQTFLWSAQTGMVGLGNQPNGYFWNAYDINDSTWIVGDGIINGQTVPVLWTPQSGMIPFYDIDPDIPAGCPCAINSLGQIAAFGNTGKRVEAILLDLETGITPLGLLFGEEFERTQASDINDRGEVVGMSRLGYPPTRYEPFIWDAQRGMRNLNDLLDPCAPYGYRRFWPPTGINNAGQIIAEPQDVGECPGAVLTPYLPGDLDDDGDVQLDDLTALLAHFGMTQNALYADGDIEECDGDVDLRDLTALLANFGETYPP